MDGSKILDIFAKELDERIDRRINDKLKIAEYDKSYNAVILGVNQDFTDDVTEEEQQALIKKYSIKEVPDKDNYYTFKINGNYYVKSSNTNFNLYENVKIRVPNGNWDNMYIEVQRDTVADVSAKWFVGIEEPMEGVKDGDYWVRLHWRWVYEDTGEPYKKPSKSIRDVFKWSEEKVEWIEEYSCVGQIIQETDDYKDDYKVSSPYDFEDTNTRTAELFNFYDIGDEVYISTVARLGDKSHSEGYQSYAHNFAGHAEGERSEAWGRNSHAEGGGVTGSSMSYTCEDGTQIDVPTNDPYSRGTGAHAESGGVAVADNSHAESRGAAWGVNSHAECGGTTYGLQAHASGAGTIARGYSQTVVGKNNEVLGEPDSTDSPVFIVGCGKSSGNRKNALWVDAEGNLYVSGNITSTEGEIDDGKTIEAGKGIVVSQNGKKTTILADIDGKTIVLDENNKLSAKTGSTYTAGEGISIADDKISVKYDDETMTVLSNGKLASKGITCALVLKEDEAATLLPEYTEVPYLSGSAVVYGDSPTAIICGNIYDGISGTSTGVKLIEHATSEDLWLNRMNNHLDAVYRQSLQMSGWLMKESVTEKFNDLLTFNYEVIVNAKTSESRPDTWRIELIITGTNRTEDNGELLPSSLAVTTYDLNQSGYTIEWDTIYPPNDLQEFGSVTGFVSMCYVNASGEKVRTTPSNWNYTKIQVPFASIKQYYAAIALTEKPPESITG